MSRRDRLGKGLGALLGEYLEPNASEAEVRRVKVSNVAPNPLQPRRTFSDTELDELAESIKVNGLLQPLVVRTAPGASADRYELVAGERRLRAVARLGWTDVPVLVREASDDTLLVLALVENLQREALNPLEEAEGYRTLGDRFSLTQAEIAQSVGKDRSTVANLLRLLALPPSIRRLLEGGDLSMGHARALLAVADPARAGELARLAVREGWSVREVERRAGEGTGSAGARRKKKRSASAGDPAVKALEEALREALSTRVSVRLGRRGIGTIELTFHGIEDLDRIVEVLTGRSTAEIVG
jgi:ParB family chromosome partitioning protein